MVGSPAEDKVFTKKVHRKVFLAMARCSDGDGRFRSFL